MKIKTLSSSKQNKVLIWTLFVYLKPVTMIFSNDIQDIQIELIYSILLFRFYMNKNVYGVLCVLCVFLEFIRQILCRACVLRVLCVFFSRDMTEQCCSFQTITDPCVLCVLYVFFGIHTSDIMPCMCFTCFVWFFFQETW